MAGRPAGIQQVAKAAAVSAATVSRVLNGVGTVNPELAARVHRVAAELAYKPNQQARSLVSHRSRTLGLLISEITNPFFPELIQTFQDVADDDGFEVMVGSTNYRPERAHLLVHQLLQRKVEGVALLTFRQESELLRPLSEQAIPLVSIDAPVSSSRALLLQIDYLRGMLEAVRHLAALGHRHVAFVGGPKPHQTNAKREEAFRTALAAVNIPVQEEWIVESDHTLEGGVRAAERLLAHMPKPTAILCSNDMTAIGVLRMAHRSSIAIPQRLSVVGLDNIHMAAYVSPALTTIEVSRVAIATRAFAALKASRDAPDRIPLLNLNIETRLVVRESTGEAPGI